MAPRDALDLASQSAPSRDVSTPVIGMTHCAGSCCGPSLPTCSVVVGDFLAGLDVPRCADVEVVIEGGIRCVTVIDVAQVTLDVEPVIFVDPQYVLAVGCRGLSLGDADHGAGRDEGLREQSLAVNGAVVDVHNGI